jgi:hypothetical protein
MKSSGDLLPTVNLILQYTINQAFACRPWLICRPAAAELLPPFCLMAGRRRSAGQLWTAERAAESNTVRTGNVRD